MTAWQAVREFKPDEVARDAAQTRIAALGVPDGSLGRLHEFAVFIAGITGDLTPVKTCQTLVFCGDHGVERRGVSAFPRAVTRSNSLLMAEGSATISYFSENLGTDLTVVDVGIDGPPISELEKSRFKWQFLDRRVCRGTGDITIEPAMTEGQVVEAIAIGYSLLGELPRRDMLVLGDMGIGNTTACGAILAAHFGVSPQLTTGNGSGVFGRQLDKKIACVTAATERFHKTGLDGTALEILRELGGLEIAAIVGALIGAAVRRVPVILDGLIVCTAYSIASSLVRGMDHLCISGTRSADAGFNILERNLNLRPVLDLGMRLGEGTAALLCFPLLKTASQQLRASATREDLLRVP